MGIPYNIWWPNDGITRAVTIADSQNIWESDIVVVKKLTAPMSSNIRGTCNQLKLSVNGICIRHHTTVQRSVPQRFVVTKEVKGVATQASCEA